MKFMGMKIVDVPVAGKYIPVNLRSLEAGTLAPKDEKKAVIPAESLIDERGIVNIEGYGKLLVTTAMSKVFVLHNQNEWTKDHPEGKDVVEITEVLDASKLTSLSQIFDGCNKLVKGPSIINTTSVKDTSSAFRGCSALTEVKLFDTSNVTNMSYMFERCRSLTSVPAFNTKSVTNMYETFSDCSKLEKINELDMSNVFDAGSMFYGCTSLKHVPQLNTSKVGNMNGMFGKCSSLEYVDGLDLSSIEDDINLFTIFDDCPNLKNVNLYNVPRKLSLTYIPAGKYTIMSYKD